MKTLYSFLISVFIVCSMTASAQLSTKGTDFWLGFSENYLGASVLKVFITSDVATTGVISVPQAGYTENFTVAANTTTMIIMPFNTVNNTGSETVNNTGIHVLANAPVSVYALN